MRYQQFASHAYCGAAGPVSKMASQQEKAVRARARARERVRACVCVRETQGAHIEGL